MSAQRYLLERALLPDGTVAAQVLLEVEAGRITRIDVGASERQRTEGGEVIALAGLSLPGFANAHSHAFHRALRGHTQAERGTFWTWRERMYQVASVLTPDSYHDLALATFAEMVASGWSSVGEFHYLHHRPDGTPYPAHAMEQALVAAAGQTGIRITLLDTLYLSSGFGAPPHGAQLRYSDGTANAWRRRVDSLAEQLVGSSHARLGVAIHSVRAADPAAIEVVARTSDELDLPLHVHLSEQPAENLDCLAAFGTSPTELLHRHGALGPRTSLVHATHLSARDIELIGGAGAFACFCPTTERDLGDGVGPSRALAEAGARLSLGTDSHAVIDPFEEMRAVEMDERLARISRGHWSAAELVAAGTHQGHASLGWHDAGRLAVGQRADLVTIDLRSPRTAGTGGGAETAVFAATNADVRQVMVDGVVRYAGEWGPIGAALDRAIAHLGEATR